MQKRTRGRVCSTRRNYLVSSLSNVHSSLLWLLLASSVLPALPSTAGAANSANLQLTALTAPVAVAARRTWRGARLSVSTVVPSHTQH